MSDGEVLGKLKARLQEISDLIDASEAKKVKARGERVVAVTEFEKYENELSATIRRYQLLEKDLHDFTERHDVQDKKLKETEASIEAIETERGEMEEKEAVLDDAINKLEEEVERKRFDLEQNENKLSADEQKKIVITRDLGKMKEKAEGLEARCTILQETLDKAEKNLEDMEERENNLQEREGLNEEKIAFLEGQNRETEVRADQAERFCATIERGIAETQNEIGHWNKKIELLEQEMLAMDEVTKIEDDIDKESAAYAQKTD